ncbi:hypothetical protein F5Y12DRAFT_24117 [Xylaria sp. FL1777]|nr:hypothetical protein F5Y12DRAFT_24117 [Xylaria sp. FL1777]
MSQSPINNNEDFGGHTMGCLDVQCNVGNPSQEHLQLSLIRHGHPDWVPVHSSDSEDDLCRTPSLEDKLHPSSLVSHHSAPPSDDPNGDSMKLFVAGEHLKDAQARERYHTLVMQAQAKDISNLKIIIDKERGLSNSLGAKLLDLFNMTTQNQQYELDKLQKQLLGLQPNAETWRFGQEWQDFQQKLHNLNFKLDGYMKSSPPQKISAGEQTDELTLFMSGLLGELPRMWNGLEKLDRDIEEEKFRDAVEKLQSYESAAERTTDDRESREDVSSANTPTRLSVTNILDRYYEFSRLQRERMATRKEKLQALLDEISTELGRFQADLTYEEGRTSNLRTRMAFWGDDLGASKVKCPATLMENLKMKQWALKCGSQELEKIANMIQELPSHFHMIDIRALGEDHTSTHPESSATGPEQASGVTQYRAGVPGQQQDTLYIAELEAKLEEKQANEKAWATHFEDLHGREKEAKIALQQQLDSAEFRNTELRRVVKTVAGRLFEHRERLWGLSTPARKLGEELISTLEQLEVTCDEPLIYE